MPLFGFPLWPSILAFILLALLSSILWTTIKSTNYRETTTEKAPLLKMYFGGVISIPYSPPRPDTNTYSAVLLPECNLEQSYEVGQQEGVGHSHGTIIIRPFFFFFKWKHCLLEKWYSTDYSFFFTTPLGEFLCGLRCRWFASCQHHPSVQHRWPLPTHSTGSSSYLKRKAVVPAEKEALGKGQRSNYYPVTSEIEICLQGSFYEL